MAGLYLLKLPNFVKFSYVNISVTKEVLRVHPSNNSEFLKICWFEWDSDRFSYPNVLVAVINNVTQNEREFIQQI